MWRKKNHADLFQVNCGCPSPSKDTKRQNYPTSKPEDRQFPSPARAEDDRFSLESKDSKDFRKFSDDSFEASTERAAPPQDHDDRSEDHYSTTSSSSPILMMDKTELKTSSVPSTSSTTTTTITLATSPKATSNFSVQSLTANSPRSHVI